MSVQVLRACVELSKEEFVVSFCEVRQRIEIASISVSEQIKVSSTTVITHLESEQTQRSRIVPYHNDDFRSATAQRPAKRRIHLLTQLSIQP